MSLATGQVLIGAAVLLPFGVAGGMPGPMSAGPVLGLLGLGALGSGIAFALNYQVIRAAGPSTASTVTYLTPLFAVVVGAIFLGETVTWYEPVGGLVVLFGVAVAQGRIRAAATAIGRRVRGAEPDLAED